MKIELVTYENPAWCYYGEYSAFSKTDKVGKFMTFGTGEITDEMQLLILKAIEQGATPLVKHTHPAAIGLNPHGSDDSWVVVWYSTDEKESLKRLAGYLVENDLVRKTKTGKLFNISFKYDEQTSSGEYGEDFKAAIKLADLMDLKTGEFY